LILSGSQHVHFHPGKRTFIATVSARFIGFPVISWATFNAFPCFLSRVKLEQSFLSVPLPPLAKWQDVIQEFRQIFRGSGEETSEGQISESGGIGGTGGFGVQNGFSH
jgi:hypothetical protein